MTITATNLFLNILDNIIISGIAIPAPPIISAITAPILIPFFNSANPIGIAVSALIYNGIPIVAATGIAKKLLEPAIFVIKSSGR